MINAGMLVIMFYAGHVNVFRFIVIDSFGDDKVDSFSYFIPANGNSL